MHSTVMEVLEACAIRHGAQPALLDKQGGQWQTTSWQEYRDQVRATARAFIALGLQPRDGVSIIGGNSKRWFIANMAAIYAGGVPSGIYVTNSPEQCHYIADHSDSSIVVVDNADQLAKFEQVRDRLPKLKAIVLMHGESDDKQVVSWSALSELAARVDAAVLEQRIRDQKADDLCTLIYTSGTTSDPKGVMICHRNLTWTAATAEGSVKLLPGDRILSYLPLSHVAEQLVSMHLPMVSGSSVWFGEGLDQLGENLREVRPTHFLAVPRVWEKMQAKIVAAGAENPPLMRKIAAWARKQGLAGGYAEQQGRRKPLLYGLARRLVFSKVHAKLGLDACRMAITSTAPISKATLEFFLSLGIPVCEVYGMSECTGPTTLSLPWNYRTGSAGPPLVGSEIKAMPDGELCLRGPHVCLGYFKNEAATRETIDAEGWLHSGDIGVIDEDGKVRITDRKKEIIITAGGENIAPQLIEGRLTAIPVVAQAVAIGDRRKFMSALLTLDPERLPIETAAAGSDARDAVAAASCQRFLAHLQQQIDEVNKSLARVQTIKKFVILPSELSIEGGELTPTLKLKRRVVHQKYAAEIESMYA